MTRFVLGLNLAAALFSLIWFAGHATVRWWDWEFWFSFGYLVLTVINVGYLRRALAAETPAPPT